MAKPAKQLTKQELALALLAELADDILHDRELRDRVSSVTERKAEDFLRAYRGYV